MYHSKVLEKVHNTYLEVPMGKPRQGTGREHVAFLGTVDGLLWDSQTKVRWLNSKQKQQSFSKLLRAHKGKESISTESKHTSF